MNFLSKLRKAWNMDGFDDGLYDDLEYEYSFDEGLEDFELKVEFLEEENENLYDDLEYEYSFDDEFNYDDYVAPVKGPKDPRYISMNRTIERLLKAKTTKSLFMSLKASYDNKDEEVFVSTFHSYFSRLSLILYKALGKEPSQFFFMNGVNFICLDILKDSSLYDIMNDLNKKCNTEKHSLGNIEVDIEVYVDAYHKILEGLINKGYSIYKICFLR